MSGRSYRVISRSSLDQDKRVRYKLWLNLSLTANAFIILICILSKKATPTPPADTYVSMLPSMLPAMHAWA